MGTHTSGKGGVMCKCRPEVRTPYCGNGDCIWPRSKPVNARPTQDRREVPAHLAQRVEALEKAIKLIGNRIMDGEALAGDPKLDHAKRLQIISEDTQHYNQLRDLLLAVSGNNGGN